LSVSVKTISTHRARIFEKMRMKNPATLAAYVVRHRFSGDASPADCSWSFTTGCQVSAE